MDDSQEIFEELLFPRPWYLTMKNNRYHYWYSILKSFLVGIIDLGLCLRI